MKDPRVIFATTKGMFVRDKSEVNEYFIYATKSVVHSIAYGIDRQLIWVASWKTIFEIEDATFNETGRRFELKGTK